MIDVYLVHIIRVHARGKPWGGPVTVFTFVHGNEGRANFLAGGIIDKLTDATGEEFSYHVDTLPLVSSDDERALYRMADEIELD